MAQRPTEFFLMDSIPLCYDIKLLKPNGYCMYRHFQHSKTLQFVHSVFICFVCTYGNSDFCPIQHSMISFYSRDGKCLLRGTKWGSNQK